MVIVPMASHGVIHLLRADVQLSGIFQRVDACSEIKEDASALCFNAEAQAVF